MPTDYKLAEIWLDALSESQYQGCGHVRLMMDEPAKYNMKGPEVLVPKYLIKVRTELRTESVRLALHEGISVCRRAPNVMRIINQLNTPLRRELKPQFGVRLNYFLCCVVN
jgi:hypothetical protein